MPHLFRSPGHLANPEHGHLANRRAYHVSGHLANLERSLSQLSIFWLGVSFSDSGFRVSLTVSGLRRVSGLGFRVSF